MKALSLIQHNLSDNHPLSGTINKIKDLVMRDWIITFDHTFREVNSCADFLAHHTSQDNLDLIIFNHPPPGCRSHLKSDMF